MAPQGSDVTCDLFWDIQFKGGSSNSLRLVAVRPADTVKVLLERIQERDPRITGNVKFFHNCRLLTDMDKSLEASGFRDGDLVVVVFVNPGGVDTGVGVCLCGDPANVRLHCGNVACDDCVLGQLQARMPTDALRVPCLLKTREHDCTWDVHDLEARLRAAGANEQHVQWVRRQLTLFSLLKEPSLRECGTCGNLCMRPPGVRVLRFKCPYCSNKKYREVYYCWRCGKEWKGKTQGSCGNADCGGEAEIVKILAEAPLLGPGFQEWGIAHVPSKRACITCGCVIELERMCKTMACRMCSTTFCFCCLGGVKPGTDDLQCGSYNTPCNAAPRQTSVPSSDR